MKKIRLGQSEGATEGGGPCGDSEITSPGVESLDTQFADDIKTLFRETFLNQDGSPKSLNEITWGDLTLMAVKLGLIDPLNDSSNIEGAMDANTNLAEIGEIAAQAADEKAKEAQTKARKCAGIVKVLSLIVSVILIIVAIVVAVVTFGAASALVVGACVLAGAIIGAAVAERGTGNLARRRRRRLCKSNDSSS